MKLITWNIQWGRGVDGRVDLARIVRCAREMADFDVLCVQEVADNFPGLEGNDDANQFAGLARLLPGYELVEGIAVDAAGDGRRRRFGNAILSRRPVVSARRHALPWPVDPAFSTMPRVAIDAVLDSPLGRVRLTTTHLEYYSAIQRHAQARRLRELHEEAALRAAAPAKAAREGPFGATANTASAILTADFNFPPEDPAYEELQRPFEGGPAYRDAWRLAEGGRPHPPTFCVHEREYAESPYCCDFIFVTEDLAPRVRRVTVDGATTASDHQPVLLELEER